MDDWRLEWAVWAQEWLSDVNREKGEAATMAEVWPRCDAPWAAARAAAAPAAMWWSAKSASCAACATVDVQAIAKEVLHA